MKMAARDNEKAGVHKIGSQAGQPLLRSEESRKPMEDFRKHDDMRSTRTKDFSKSLASIPRGKQEMPIPPKSVQEGMQPTVLPPQFDETGASCVRFPSNHGVSVCTEKIPLESIFHKFSSKIKTLLNENHSSVSVKLERNDKDAICVLKGAPGDVKEVESKLQDIVETLHKREVKFPTNTNRALKDISIEDIVSNLLKDKFPSCVVQQLQNKIFLYGFDDEVLKKAITFLSMKVVGKDMLLYGRLRELKELVVGHFKNKHKDQIVVYVDNTCRLYMVGLKEVVAEASSEFVELSEGRKSLSPQHTNSDTPKEPTGVVGPLEPIQFRFLKTSVKLAQVGKQYKVDICLQEKDNTVTIKGSHENITRATEELYQIYSYIVTDWMDISNPKSAKYFTSNEGDKDVEICRKKYDVFLEKKLIFSCGKLRVTKEVHKDYSIWTTSEGKQLAVEMSSIEKFTAHLKFIPSRSDPNKGGRFIATTKNTVEMVIPDMVNGGKSDFENVERVLNKALEKAADSSNAKSVAFRLSPVANWDFGSLMKCMVDCFVYWLLTSTPRRPFSVVLCTENREDFFSTEKYTDSCLRTMLEEQPKICIMKGCLDRATADVIVNTADRNLDLSYGKVSQALLKAAGQELQNECRKQFSNGIRCDEVAVTDGYKLNCKRVFHITLQTQDRSSAGLIQSIRNAMLLCLKTASDYGYKSIAFPAMGTGSLGYPSEEVASEMIMGVERFSKEHRRGISVQEVQFVIFPTDESLLQIFQKKKTKLVDTRIPVKSESEPAVRFGITGVGKDVYAFTTWLDSRDKLVANAKPTNVSGSTSGHNRSCHAARHSADDRTYLCGNISIKVYEANVLEVSVDCIVSPANKNLDNSGGIARIIAKAAGNRFNTECTELIKEKGLFSVTSVARTSAGNLQNCKHILHAVGPDYTDYTPFTKSSLDKCEHELYQTILNSLYQASELKFQTVALPTMTSGVYRVPEEVRQICAIQFAKAIKDFSSACPSLQEIHVVDENRDMIDIIHKTFDAILNNGKPAPFDTAKFIVQIKNVHASYTCNSKTLACKLCSDVELEVQVYESDIVNLKGIDAVVCSENRVGGAKGIVARLLLQKGGEEYKKEKASMFQSQPRFGEIITTRGGGNTYSSIIHAILSRKDPNAIPLMYSKIFKEVEEKGFTSVSIPLLGTGVGDVDPGSSSEMLLAQLIQFCQTNSKPFTLHVVINDKPVAEVVKDVFKRRIYEMEREQRAETKGMDSKNVEEKTVPTDTGAATSKEKADADGDCVICMDKVTDAKTLKCGHMFCAECIEGYFRVKKVCPTCGEVCGTITGDQPDGRMDIVKQPANVAGFEKYKSIAITYTFSHGTQGPDHPRPGLPYKGIRRTAYLPDNREGRQICAMLKVAFARRLVFTIGTSRTTGKECVITWNDIHHKTDMRPNTQFGYPDETYLQRVREELEAKGVSLQDVEKNFIKELKADDFRETFATDTRL